MYVSHYSVHICFLKLAFYMLSITLMLIYQQVPNSILRNNVEWLEKNA